MHKAPLAIPLAATGVVADVDRPCDAHGDEARADATVRNVVLVYAAYADGSSQ